MTNLMALRALNAERWARCTILPKRQAEVDAVARKLDGDIDGDKAMALFKEYRAASPRGPIEIDPATRDIVQSVYVRRVEKVGGALYNVEFDRYPHFKDPGK